MVRHKEAVTPKASLDESESASERPFYNGLLGRSMPVAARLLTNRRGWRSMPVDIKESQSAYTILLDLPGVKKEDIKVLIDPGDVLVVVAERKQDGRNEESETFLRVERMVPAKLYRGFLIPENAEKDKITAQVEDGVLAVSVPKTASREPPKPRAIPVKGPSGWRTHSKL